MAPGKLLIRDVWLIVCGYIVPREAIKKDDAEMVAWWWFMLGITASEAMPLPLEVVVRYYRRALDVFPSDGYVYGHRSEAYAQSGKYAESLADADRGLNLCSGSNYERAFLLSRKAIALAGLKEHDNAVDCAHKAIQTGLRHPVKIEDCRNLIQAQEHARVLKIVRTSSIAAARLMYPLLPWRLMKAAETVAIERAAASLRSRDAALRSSDDAKTGAPQKDRPSKPIKPTAEWTVLDVGTWLRSLGTAYVPYLDRFADNGMDGRGLLILDDRRLRLLGIENEIHRARLLLDIQPQQPQPPLQQPHAPPQHLHPPLS